MTIIERGIPVNCHLDVGWYNKTGNLYIGVIAEYDDGDAKFCDLTSMPKSVQLPYGYGYLNPMFPKGEKFIQENDLGEPTGAQVVSGYNIYLEYKFNMQNIMPEWEVMTDEENDNSDEY